MISELKPIRISLNQMGRMVVQHAAGLRRKMRLGTSVQMEKAGLVQKVPWCVQEDHVCIKTNKHLTKSTGTKSELIGMNQTKQTSNQLEKKHISADWWF